MEKPLASYSVHIPKERRLADIPQDMLALVNIQTKIPISLLKSPFCLRWIFEAAAFIWSPKKLSRLEASTHRVPHLPKLAIREWREKQNRQPVAIVCFLHGGGWVIGSSRSHRAICEALVAIGNCVVFSPDYRRAPEHPYPAALDDVEASWYWLKSLQKQRGWQDLPLILMGDSAGGHLALALCHRILQKSKAMLPHAMQLIYPVVHFNKNCASHPCDEGLLLTKSQLGWFKDCYANHNMADNVELSPMNSPYLADFPKTFIALAEFDFLTPDGQDLAESLKKVGVEVEVQIIPGAIHGFINFMSIKSAQAATHRALQALIQSLKRIDRCT